MDRESETIRGSNSTHDYEIGKMVESFQSGEKEIRPTEAESVTAKDLQHEQNEVPKKRSRNVTWKWNSRGLFIGEIRHVGDGNLEWKDGNEWGKV